MAGSKADFLTLLVRFLVQLNAHLELFNMLTRTRNKTIQPHKTTIHEPPRSGPSSWHVDTWDAVNGTEPSTRRMWWQRQLEEKNKIIRKEISFMVVTLVATSKMNAFCFLSLQFTMELGILNYSTHFLFCFASGI